MQSTVGYTGSCLCGGVQFTIAGTLEPIQICHCKQCQKAQGTALVSVIPVRAEAFEFTAGRALLQAWNSPTVPGKSRLFCRRCGSPIISRRSSQPGFVRVRTGCINEDLPMQVASHAFVANKANWWRISDTAPQFDGAVPPST